MERGLEKKEGNQMVSRYWDYRISEELHSLSHATNLEIKICLVCRGKFIRRKDRTHRKAGNKYYRPVGSVTCCEKCSRLYTRTRYHKLRHNTPYA